MSILRIKLREVNLSAQDHIASNLKAWICSLNNNSFTAGDTTGHWVQLRESFKQMASPAGIRDLGGSQEDR